MLSLAKWDLYRMPWSMNDNPIGWLETTDKCNILCMGCYRQEIAGHKPLEALKEDIRFFKQWRNCYNISIAGGEPLLHPDIVEIVAYIHEMGMKPLLLTNGRKLTREILVELKKAGLLGVAFHIDKMQNRQPEWNHKTEVELNTLRQHYVDLVHDVGGLYCNCGMTVYRSNVAEIPDVIRWANRNLDRVHGLVFITFRAAPVDQGVEYVKPDGTPAEATELSYSAGQAVMEDTGLTSEDVWRAIRTDFPHYDASAYLGGTANHASVKWLLGVQIGSRKAMYGSIGPRTMELAQVYYHWVRGTYLTYLRSNRVAVPAFLLGLADPRVRAAVRAFLSDVIRHPGRLFQPMYMQSVGIIQAPDLMNDGRTDMCDSCPDMTVYDGHLINSCRMDEWRLFGSYLIPKMQPAESRPQDVPAGDIAYEVEPPIGERMK
jgi:Radical SAM superfamily